MQLFLTLAMVVALSSNSYDLPTPELHPLWRTVLVVLGMLVPGMISRSGARKLVGQINRGLIDVEAIERKRARIESNAIYGWIVSSACIIFLCNWGQLVHEVCGLRDAILIDELLIVFPIWLPCLGIWIANHRVEVALRQRAVIESKSDAISKTPPIQLWRVLWSNFRQTMLLTLVPVLAILAIADLSHWLQLSEDAEQLGCWAVIAAIPLGLPVLVRYVLKVKPIRSGPIHGLVAETFRSSRVRIPGVYLWQSDNRVVNALVTGVLPWFRYLFLSDGLLNRLTEPEIKAVIAHEAAHIRQRHLQFILASFALPILLTCLILEIMQDQMGGTSGLETSIMLSMLSCWLIMNRFHARMLEHHADLDACRILMTGEPPRTGSTAGSITPMMAEQVSQALRRISPGGPEGGQDWWHPSINHRISRLTEFVQCDQARAQFEGRVTAVHRLIAGGVIWLLLVIIGLALVL